ncbi:hypothetical protein HKK55_11915 [Pseudomonas sp. ADAK18]|uniref:PLDc N-terminal domain-containing protein n=1 Tax=Pseudomonas sp. ADAK18 TaxID=2730848 RepID=UPI001463720F|nr:PLDc N-terminal domain-containing protein [Pseudomonas sp. ADAK18]QJI29394.1 hypothetical protein HKK55_11915 [Pseudomonas sp. ADAK18]
MQIEYVWIGLAVLLVLAELWAINQVLRSSSLWENKGLWLVVIIFMPLLGLILWGLFGRGAASSEHSKG